MSDNHDKKKLENDDLLGLLVHSYNNYLAGMMGYSELAMLETNNDDIIDRLNRSLASGNEAVHFSKTILASISRLQVPMKSLSLKELVHSGIKGSAKKIICYDEKLIEKISINTDSQWFIECLTDTFDFLTRLSKDSELPIQIRFEIDDGFVVMNIFTDKMALDEKHVDSLFEPFYSSRTISGSKDIGLAKARGFFKQTKGQLSWVNDKGVVLRLPVFRT